MSFCSWICICILQMYTNLLKLKARFYISFNIVTNRYRDGIRDSHKQIVSKRLLLLLMIFIV